MARRPQPREKSRNIMQMQMNMDANAEYKRERWKKGIEYRESIDGQRHESGLKLCRDVHEVEKPCLIHLAEVAEKLKLDLINFIKQELKSKKLEFSEIEQIVVDCLPAFKRLKKLASEELIQKKISTAEYSVYESFFGELINLDARFALFAPLKSINKPSVQPKIEKLPSGLLFELNRYKRKLRKNENLDYVRIAQMQECDENNLRAKHIKEMDADVKKEISKVVSKMTKATESLRDAIYNYFVAQMEVYKNKNGKVSDEDIKKITFSARSAKTKLEQLANNRYIIKKAQWEDDIVQDLLDRLQVLDSRIVFEDLAVDPVSL